ncbi:hypothetical protein GCM10020331_063740 [Ectobacillus funiculus]
MNHVRSKFPEGFFYGAEQRLLTKWKADFYEGNKGMNIADVLPGGKERLKILLSPGFDFKN